ncbi:hypothetical protein SNE40_008813 [Patella caerulea]|uniref:Ig-like domain-containing protein n=1 Tax=Patella caerulea TaxID=87958 RepID=A0AAN8JS76_PATCE
MMVLVYFLIGTCFITLHVDGAAVPDKTDDDTAPRITKQPEYVLIYRDSLATSIDLECEAGNVPNPHYQWYKNYDTKFRIHLDPGTDRRYTFTKGRLTIRNPDVNVDPGDYRCVASNQYGSVISDPAKVEVAFLNKFDDRFRENVTGHLFGRFSIDCRVPLHYPDVEYTWYKDDLPLQDHIDVFPSQNGRLYFSYFMASGKFVCSVTMKKPKGGGFVPQTENSSDINVLFTRQGAHANHATSVIPIFPEELPAVFPYPPMKGEELKLECVALGRAKSYSWTKGDGGLPAKVRFEQYNRVLVIPDAKLEDSGLYTCTAHGPYFVTPGEYDNKKSFNLTVQAKPYFTQILKDEGVTEGSKVSWRCEAKGEPAPSYTWIKNEQIIRPIPGDIEIKDNVLTIHAAYKRRGGLYQCQAKNIHGSTYTSAQLRVSDTKVIG